jgi:hypothetical protein
MLRHQNLQLQQQVVRQQLALDSRNDGIHLVENLVLDLEELLAQKEQNRPGAGLERSQAVLTRVRRLREAASLLHIVHASQPAPWLDGGLRGFLAHPTPDASDNASNRRGSPLTREIRHARDSAAKAPRLATLAACAEDELASPTGVNLIQLAQGGWEHLNLQHVARLELELADLRDKLCGLATAARGSPRAGTSLFCSEQLNDALRAVDECCQHLLQLSILLPAPGHPALRDELPPSPHGFAIRLPDAQEVLNALPPLGRHAASMKKTLAIAWEMASVERDALAQELVMLRAALDTARKQVETQVYPEGLSSLLIAWLMENSLTPLSHLHVSGRSNFALKLWTRLTRPTSCSGPNFGAMQAYLCG